MVNTCSEFHDLLNDRKVTGPIRERCGQGPHLGKYLGIIEQSLFETPAVFLVVINLRFPNQGRNVNPDRTFHLAATAVQALIKR